MWWGGTNSSPASLDRRETPLRNEETVAKFWLIVLLVIGCLLVEYALWRSDPRRSDYKAAWYNELRHGWARFIYEEMNYGSGELDHWK